MHEKYFDHEQRGEFRGDFSRDTYDPFRHFSRVLMQQGRVQVDADWNEQVSIFWHFLRALAQDIGGEHWAPWGASNAFKISLNDDKDDLWIGAGSYYVKGVLCENHRDWLYSKQDAFPFTENPDVGNLESGVPYLVYLDAWERHLTYIEDDYMREVALAGPDTAARSKIVWQVKLKAVTNWTGEEIDGFIKRIKGDYEAFINALGGVQKPGSGYLRARAAIDHQQDSEPCVVAPDARYRGPENQLYRVEIHKAGTAEKATFKWSSENGAVVFPILSVAGTKISLEHLGRDHRFGLNPDDWVEIVDDNYALLGEVEPLLQVASVDPENMEVTLKREPTIDLDGIGDRHPYLRRWDHTSHLEDGDVAVAEMRGENQEDWIMLENGVAVQFPGLDADDKSAEYMSGDYWIIPARTATGDVQWPQVPDNLSGEPISKPLAPHGVKHYYAPLAVAVVDENGVTVLADVRRRMKKAWN